MMYSNPRNFEKEFILRTKENIRILDDNGGPYDVTQFINSMLGLLIIPKEKYYHQINNSMIDPELLRQIRSCCCLESGSLRHIIIKLRNAASHGHLNFEAGTHDDGVEINHIKTVIFRDYDDYNSPHPTQINFEARIEIDLLKRFILAFANAIIVLIRES